MRLWPMVLSLQRNLPLFSSPTLAARARTLSSSAPPLGLRGIAGDRILGRSTPGASSIFFLQRARSPHVGRTHTCGGQHRDK